MYTDQLPRRDRYEIQHYPGFDIVVTANPHLYDEASLLAKEFQKGIPPGWSLYSPHKDNQNNLFVDDIEKPELLAKIKTKVNPNDFAKLQAEAFNAWVRKAQQAQNSVLNEMALAPEIREIVKSQGMQAVAKECGFDTFEFVEPLIGVIDHVKRQKIMVYPFVIGHSSLDKKVMRGKNLIKQQLGKGSFVKFSNLFDEKLSQKGIVAMDFGDYQFLAHEDESGKHLYLIDIEGFFRDQTD